MASVWPSDRRTFQDTTPPRGRRPLARRGAWRAGLCAGLLLLGCGPLVAGAQELPVAAAAPGAASPPGAGPADPAADSRRLAAVRSRIETLKASIERDGEARDKLQLDIEQTEARLAENARERRRIAAEMATQETALDLARRNRDRIERGLAGQRAWLGRQMRAAYMSGRQAETRLLLSQSDPAAVGRLLAYYEWIARRRLATFGAVRAELARLDAAEAGLAASMDALRAREAEGREARAELDQLKGERGRLLVGLRQRLAGAGTELKQLEQTETATAKLLRDLGTRLADVPADPGAPPLAAQRGRLEWPVRGPLLASWGQPKAGGKLTWKGLWIAAPEGAPVRAAAPGRVVYVGAMHRYGLIVVVEHAGGFFTLYGHTQTVTQTVGAEVAAGTPIATAGDSGGHDAPGVYFEVRQGTVAENPLGWLMP